MQASSLGMLPLQWEIIKCSLPKYRWVLSAFVITTALAALLAVSSPFLLAQAIQSTPTDLLSVGMLLTAYAVTIAGGRLLQDVKLVLTNRLEQGIRDRTNRECMAILLDSRAPLFSTHNSSKITAILESLHQSNRIYVQNILMVAIGGLVEILLSLVAIAGLVNWMVSLLIVLYGLSSVGLSQRANTATGQFLSVAQSKATEGANLLGNVMANIIPIRVFRARPWILELYGQCSSSVHDNWNKFYLARIRFGLLQAGILFAQYVAILATAIWSAPETGRISALVATALLLTQLNRPFELVGVTIRDLALARGMAAPAGDILEEYRGLPAGDPEVDRVPKFLHGPTVRIEELSYAHEGAGQSILKDFSTEFSRGSINYIIGPSGVGKSTILSLLLRMNDDYAGSILLDGEELRDLDEGSYFDLVGYVPQDPVLMNATIRDNVLFGRDLSDDDVLAVLRRVRLGEKIGSLANSLDTVVGERGQLLSGGERQRLSLARALLSSPTILLLDEASSALDEATEREITEVLREVAQDATVIAVTHRTKLIRSSDRVTVLGGVPACEDGLVAAVSDVRQT